MPLNRICVGVAIFIALFAGPTCTSQTSLERDNRQLFEQVTDSENRVAACAKRGREEQIRKYGKLIPLPSGHCWGGCPVRLVKPYYPELARRAGIIGNVRVEAIVDEAGRVIDARTITGPKIFETAAEMAARASLYQPRLDCDYRPLKFRWTITYRFMPGR